MAELGAADAAPYPEAADRPARGSHVRGPGPSRQRLAFDTARADARAAIRRWLREDRSEVVAWMALSLAVGGGLLVASLGVAALAGPGSQPVVPVFADPTAGAQDALRIAASNAVVLLLHALVCAATYLAVRSIAVRARRREGSDRLLREVVGPVAVAVVVLMTCVSLTSQAWHLGHDLAPAAATLHRSTADLLLRLTLHAAPELCGIFLPLAACVLLVRARRYQDLLGAAVLSTLIALPLIAAAACCEVWATRLVL